MISFEWFESMKTRNQNNGISHELYIQSFSYLNYIRSSLKCFFWRGCVGTCKSGSEKTSSTSTIKKGTTQVISAQWLQSTGEKKTPIHSHPVVASTFLKLQEMFSCGRRSTAWSNLLGPKISGIWAVGVPKIGWFFGGAPKNHDNSWFGMTINNDNNNNNNVILNDSDWLDASCQLPQSAHPL